MAGGAAKFVAHDYTESLAVVRARGRDVIAGAAFRMHVFNVFGAVSQGDWLRLVVLNSIGPERAPGSCRVRAMAVPCFFVGDVHLVGGKSIGTQIERAVIV